MKTGTPPRIDGRSLDWSVMTRQPGDVPTPVFSFLGRVEENPRQVNCFITHTNERTHEIIRSATDRFSIQILSLVDTDPGPLKAFMWIIDHLFNLRGVDQSTPVVVYDEQSGIRAARAFWFLEYFGHPRVQVLDGGFGAWLKAGLRVTRGFNAPGSRANPGRRSGMPSKFKSAERSVLLV